MHLGTLEVSLRDFDEELCLGFSRVCEDWRMIQYICFWMIQNAKLYRMTSPLLKNLDVRRRIFYRPDVGKRFFSVLQIGDQSSVTKSLDKKLIEFKRLCGRLQVLNSHDAFFLLRNCFSVPKLLYTLRSAPCYANHLLKQYDDTIRNTLQLILNISLSDSSWDQASLPISSGGIGVRLAADLALPAFLSSVAGSLDLVKKLTPPRLHDSVGDLDPYLIATRDRGVAHLV